MHIIIETVQERKLRFGIWSPPAFREEGNSNPCVKYVELPRVWNFGGQWNLAYLSRMEFVTLHSSIFGYFLVCELNAQYRQILKFPQIGAQKLFILFKTTSGLEFFHILARQILVCTIDCAGMKPQQHMHTDSRASSPRLLKRTSGRVAVYTYITSLSAPES
jgi:hypothetical protein